VLDGDSIDLAGDGPVLDEHLEWDVHVCGMVVILGKEHVVLEHLGADPEGLIRDEERPRLVAVGPILDVWSDAKDGTFTFKELHIAFDLVVLVSRKGRGGPKVAPLLQE
jgi:hypothetical protein